MAEFISEISFTEFKKLKAGELKQLQSFAIISDGEYLMTIIIPQTDFIKTQVEYLAQLSNSVGGKEIKELLVN